MSSPYIARDISWLFFNNRVLQEAQDPSVPVLEKIKFLAIYSSNLDEFFRVRVATIRSVMRLGKKSTNKLDTDYEQLHADIMALVRHQQMLFQEIFFKGIIPELRKEGISLLKPDKLTTTQVLYARQYFQDKVAPFVQPVLLNKQKIRPFLVNGALYLSVSLNDKKSLYRYALVRIPSGDTPRFIQLPESKKGQLDLIMLDDLVRLNLDMLFPGYVIVNAHSFKLTRDAELHIDDEYQGDLIDKIRSSLVKRNAGPPTRFIYDAEIPTKKLKLLASLFEVSEKDMLPEGKYHNNADLFQFPNCGKPKLSYKPYPPIPHAELSKESSVINAVLKKDYLLHYPYQSYDEVIRFFEEAAVDPEVIHIRISLYRVAKRSKIIDALIKALEQGKKVTVFVELKARFDEDANFRWAEQLEESGAEVLYSLPGIKVHAKLAMVTRRKGRTQKRIAYMSTGNFNESTSKLYTDYGYFTADNKVTDEVRMIFEFLTTGERSIKPFNKLLVAQFNMYDTLMACIDQEIANAKSGKASGITIKVNSIEEKKIIDKLYEASAAGVKIRMIVRGICCLRPGVPELSENIEARSIVDRFLEHSRVYLFHNNGDEKIWLSSADLMVRNLFHRVECAFPITDPTLKASVKQALALQFADNQKARNLSPHAMNTYLGNPDTPKVQSQMAIYNTYKEDK